MKVSPRRAQASRILVLSRMTLLLASAALSACGPGGASPIPQPIMLQVGNLTVVEPNPVGEEFPSIKGARGSAPPGSVVRITDLDSTAAPFTGAVANDGSFVVSILANTGDELRFEWVHGPQRSPPLDAFLTDSANGVLLSESPRFECLKTSPGLVLQFSASETQTLSLSNDCQQTLVLDNSRARLGSPDFSLATALPVNLAPMMSASLAVAFTPSMVNETEDVLFVDVTNGAQSIRYPITLAVPLPPSP